MKTVDRSKKCPKCGAKPGEACMGAPVKAGAKTAWDEAVHRQRLFQ